MSQLRREGLSCVTGRREEWVVRFLQICSCIPEDEDGSCFLYAMEKMCSLVGSMCEKRHQRFGRVAKLKD